jgi:hypothetical protein
VRARIASLPRSVRGDFRVECAKHDLASYSGLELLRHYCRLLDLHRRIRQAFSAYGLGGDDGAGRAVLLLAMLFVVGARRLEHLRYLARGPLVAGLCWLARLSSGRTVVTWLKQFTQAAPQLGSGPAAAGGDPSPDCMSARRRVRIRRGSACATV